MYLSLKTATRFLIVMSILVESLAFKINKKKVRNEIFVTGVKCVAIDPKVVTIDLCDLKPIRRNVKLLTVRISFAPVVDNLIVHFRIWKRANGYRPFPINVKLDMCQYFAGSRNPVFDWCYDFLRPYTDVNHTCPYRNNVRFENVPVNSISLPSVFPGGDYRLDFWVYYNGQLRSTLQTFATVKET